MANNSMRYMTNGTGIRIANALEGMSISGDKPNVKIPVFSDLILREIAHAAENDGMNATTEITKANASTMFLNALEALYKHGRDPGNTVAYLNYHYMNLFLQEALSCTKSICSMQDGIVVSIKECPVQICPDEIMPAGTAFIIVGKEIIDGLNTLAQSGELDFYYGYSSQEYNPEATAQLASIRDELDALFRENEFNLFYHGSQPVLKNMPVVTVATDTGKTTIKLKYTKEKNTNKWFYKTAEDQASLPTTVYGTSVDVTSSSSVWYQATELTAMETEITPTSGHTKVRVVEVLRSMKPIGVGDAYLNIGE